MTVLSQTIFFLAQAAGGQQESSSDAKSATDGSDSLAKSGFESIESADGIYAKGSALYTIVEEFVITYAPKFMFAMVWLIVGFILIKIISALANRALKLRHIDASVRGFIMSVLKLGLKILLFIMVLGALGVPTASLGFIFGAVSLAVGFALKDTLQNFAGGIVILVLKPYRLGDFIEAKGFSGTVRDIQMFNTILTTGDNRRIIIPNGQLSTSAMINYSSEDNRRLEVSIGIGYDDDIERARQVMQSIIDADERTLKNPEPIIKVGELADSSVNFIVRVWVARGDYWGYRVDLLEKVKKAFDSEGISIPYPQSEVTMRKASE